MPKKKYRKFIVISCGYEKTMAEHCADLGLAYDTVLSRINRLPKPFFPDKDNCIYIPGNHPVFKKVKSK
jgi:hypothetical protein